MRRDDRLIGFDDLMDAGMDLPFDADLESLDAELSQSGEQARRMLYGKLQPTRVFTNELRTHLLGALMTPVAVAVATPVAVPILGSAEGAPTRSPVAVSGETRSAATQRSTVRRGPSIPLRPALALLAALGLLIVAALGGSFELLLR